MSKNEALLIKRNIHLAASKVNRVAELRVRESVDAVYEAMKEESWSRSLFFYKMPFVVADCGSLKQEAKLLRSGIYPFLKPTRHYFEKEWSTALASIRCLPLVAQGKNIFQRLEDAQMCTMATHGGVNAILASRLLGYFAYHCLNGAVCGKSRSELFDIIADGRTVWGTFSADSGLAQKAKDSLPDGYMNQLGLAVMRVVSLIRTDFMRTGVVPIDFVANRLSLEAKTDSGDALAVVILAVYLLGFANEGNVESVYRAVQQFANTYLTVLFHTLLYLESV